MKMSKRCCSKWVARRSSMMVPLVTCVIVLQTLILIRMSGDKLQESVEDGPSEISTKSGNAADQIVQATYTRTASQTVENGTHMFDWQSCQCGLHFQVNRQQALLSPNNVTTDKKYLTIGIPTIRRRNDSYIIKTVTSLISNMDAVQQNDVIIVVMLADTDPANRDLTNQELHSNFGEAILAGNLHVIAPPPDLYSNFKVTKQTYGQDLQYIEWRAKQNFDYAFLMRYSYPLSLYYMQLEDDVIAAQDFLSSIRQYIDEQKDAWTCLEFSELGYIGKLYRSKDVERLSQLLMMFFQEQPVDYTYLYFNMLMTQLQKRLRTPTLFQHQGIHSSFPGKIQPLKDRYFDNMKKRYKGDNPPAEIYTTFKTYLNFLPRLPYSQAEGYFWTDGSPSVGDSYIIVFEEPQLLKRVVVDTGSESHPEDILEHASLKVSLTLVKNPARLECTNDIDLGVFQNGRIEIRDMTSLVKFKVVCLQIHVRKEQSPWAIIREIGVFVAEQS